MDFLGQAHYIFTVYSLLILKAWNVSLAYVVRETVYFYILIYITK